MSRTPKKVKNHKRVKKKLLCCVFCVFCAVFFSFILLSISKNPTKRNGNETWSEKSKSSPEALPDGYGKLWEGEARNRQEENNGNFQQKKSKTVKVEKKTRKNDFHQEKNSKLFVFSVFEISKLNRTNVRKTPFKICQLPFVLNFDFQVICLAVRRQGTLFRRLLRTRPAGAHWKSDSPKWHKAWLSQKHQ